MPKRLQQLERAMKTSRPHLMASAASNIGSYSVGRKRWGSSSSGATKPGVKLSSERRGGGAATQRAPPRKYSLQSSRYASRSVERLLQPIGASMI